MDLSPGDGKTGYGAFTVYYAAGEEMLQQGQGKIENRK
jgi:hypothetical protein